MLKYLLIRPMLILGLILNCTQEKSSKTQIIFNSLPVTKLNPIKRDYWPTNDWKSKKPTQLNVNEKILNDLDKYMFTTIGKEEERKGIRTDGMIIIKNGSIIFEKYARNYSEQSPHLLWSVSKSVFQTILGIAHLEKLFQLDDFVFQKFPELDNDVLHKQITYRHLLNMSSGLDAHEGYESNPFNSTVITMLYTEGRKDMASYSAKLPIRYEPGTYVYYSSCDSNLLSGALKNILGRNEYHSYPWTKLFNKLGMKNVTWEQDASGSFVASSYLYMTPRDLAKIAYLYLNNGYWENEKILSEDWIQFTRTLAQGYSTTPDYEGLEEDNLSAQWYVNTGIPENTSRKQRFPKPWPDGPDDVFAASGHWGQFVFIIPSLDIIVVRTGDDRDHSLDKNYVLKLIVAMNQKEL